MTKTKRFLISVLAFSIMACAGTSSKTVETGAELKHSFRPNSYYYFLASQLKSFAQDEKEAEKYLVLALENDKESSFLWNQMSYVDAHRGDLVAALKDAKISLLKDASNVDSLILVGKLHAVRQEPLSAVSYYRKALTLDPKNEEAYNLLARDLLMADDKAGSINALKACLSELPESMSCLYYLGTVHMEAGKLDEALKYFTLITEYYPDQGKILNLMGEIYIKKERYDKALEVFRELSRLNPTDLVSQIRVGLLYYQLKNIDKAIREFSKVSKSFPKSDKVNYFLGLMFLDKLHLDEAYAYFDRIPVDSSFFGEAFNRQILILKEKNELGKAVQLINERYKEKTSDYYQIKVSLQLFEGNQTAALQTLNEGLKKFKNDEKMLFQRAVVFEKLGSWDKAKKDLEMLVALGKASADAYNYLGYTMAERGEDLDTALKYVEKAHEMDPTEGHILDSLGWVYFRMNKLDKALPLLLRANKLEANEPTILEHIGDIYFALKNKRQAREFYEKSLAVLKNTKKVRDEEQDQIQSIERKLAGF